MGIEPMSERMGSFFAEEQFQPRTGVLVQFAFLTILTIGMESGR